MGEIDEFATPSSTILDRLAVYDAHGHRGGMAMQIGATRNGTPRPRATGKPGSVHDAVFDRLLDERIIVLGTQVDDDVANQLCAQMLLLSADDARRDIHLYINSPGGSVSAGMAVFDTMRFVDCDVATYAFGMAASMGQFLLTAGTAGKRFALPRTRIMMHQVSAGVGGTESDIAIQADMLRRLKHDVNELQSQHSGQPVDQIERDSDRDRWFTSEEAREYGLIDHVVASAAGLPVGVDPLTSGGQA